MSLCTRLAAFACLALLLASSTASYGVTVLGTGTAALLDGDRTDPENNGNPEANVGYNAVFFASEEPAFGGGESAFNVFDNQVGGGNAKWCCGDGATNFPTNPLIVGATLPAPITLTHFTLTSGNDTPERDPRVWQLQGSNDLNNWTTIYSQNNPSASLWTARDQVLLFNSADFTAPGAFNSYRLVVNATGLTTGARFQLNEIELFGNDIPEPASMGLLGLAGLALGMRRRRTA